MPRGGFDNACFLRSPRGGTGVCVDCFNFTRGFSRCFACSRSERQLAAIVPISYSIGHEYLHHLLASYKRLPPDRAAPAVSQLSAILGRFLELHEACVAAAAGVDRFELVTTVPSSDLIRDESHPLRRIVGEIVGPTRHRHERLLRPTSAPVESHHFDVRRCAATRPLHGADVLLIDDTWTTGASAQSAAAALRVAGARTVAVVVIGRHLNRDWYENDRHLAELSTRFDWSTCALCAERQASERDALVQAA